MTTAFLTKITVGTPQMIDALDKAEKRIAELEAANKSNIETIRSLTEQSRRDGKLIQELTWAKALAEQKVIDLRQSLRIMERIQTAFPSDDMKKLKEAIRRAYSRISRVAHPDRGGSHEIMQVVVDELSKLGE